MKRSGTKYDQAVAALLTHGTVAAAAAALGITEAKLSRQLEDPQFAHIYQEARRRALSMGLAHAAVVAIDTLISIMQTARAPVGSKLAAARIVLHALEAIEREEFTSLLEGLEEEERNQQQQQGKGGRR